jgi:hypothetical protein
MNGVAAALIFVAKPPIFPAEKVKDLLALIEQRCPLVGEGFAGCKAARRVVEACSATSFVSTAREKD